MPAQRRKDMSSQFTPEDVERMKAILRFHPQGDEVESSLSDMMAAQDLANQLKYPINSFSDLVKQLGSEKVVKFGGDEIKVKDLRSRIPAYYIPITSPEDFMDKSAELIKQHRWSVRITPETPGIGEGRSMPLNQAPALPEEILRLKAPSTVPAERAIGYRKEDVDRMLSTGGEIR